jgi:hypothetical protein
MVASPRMIPDQPKIIFMIGLMGGAADTTVGDHGRRKSKPMAPKRSASIGITSQNMLLIIHSFNWSTDSPPFSQKPSDSEFLNKFT